MLHKTKKMLTLCATGVATIAFFMTANVNEVKAQSPVVPRAVFTNEGGVYEVDESGGGGIIKMKGLSESVATVAGDDIHGKFVGMGTDAQPLNSTTTNGRIPGSVVWSRNAPVQEVQPDIYYTNLYVYSTQNGWVQTKQFIEGTYRVSGTFDFFGDDKTDGYRTFIEHLCSSIFDYDGNFTDVANPQTILRTLPAASGNKHNNSYNKLIVSNYLGGAKFAKIPAGDSVYVQTVSVATSSSLHVGGTTESQGKLAILNKYDPEAAYAAFCADPVPSDIDDGGEIILEDCESYFVMRDDTKVIIKGKIENECPDCDPDTDPTCGDNFVVVPCTNPTDPDCKGTTEIVYICPNEILSTTPAGPYAIVEIQCPTGGYPAEPGDDCNTDPANLLTLTDGSISVSNLLRLNSSLNTGTNKIRMTNVAADILYNLCCAEVIGLIQRDASAINQSYTFHNIATKVAFETAPSKYFAMEILPKTKPDKMRIDPTSNYINRKVTFSYDDNAGKISSMNIAYRNSEVVDAAGASLGDLERTAFLTKMRGFEAWDANQEMLVLAGNNNGVTNPWVRSGDDCFDIVMNQTFPIDLDGVTANDPEDGNFHNVGNGNQLVFADQPVWFISRRPGRWSDPEMWNHGTTPTSTDNVKLRHTVYTGWGDGTNRDLFGARQYSNQSWVTTEASEHLLPGTTAPDPKSGQPNTLADTLIIEDYTATVADQQGALVIGNDAKVDKHFGANSAVTAGIDMKVPLRFNVIENQVTGSNATIATLENTITSGATAAYGILITTGNDANGPKLNGVGLLNKGIFTNRGVFSVGIGDND